MKKIVVVFENALNKLIRMGYQILSESKSRRKNNFSESAIYIMTFKPKVSKRRECVKVDKS